ncbi:DeoR/GlpR family DNA-binding transcription regulator [Paraglaciecola aquimarina]|uniref:DeoR/GlpR family DNA-binding transcription regulator n=1 Tax=Paraglaciecola algarum TaxID=3050085 RepID=A0ABS9D214_9ALTE|nr:DeoR/GlpR family DNA-binding transcription regulator [Paraglaciecola sp. G1-23]MCF2946963.1 DeoR/GlpR family DNA-binding transcription regulator [Paraglaciecola sp. G1-23]
MLEKHRQQLIKDILDQQQFASVPDLTKKLNASEATIRRDITKMSKRGEINKIRGGAESINGEPKKKHIASSAFIVDKAKRVNTKKLIAKRAVELCENGGSIIINGGSSTYMMGEYLANFSLNILTNSFVLANYLSEHSDIQVTLPGGEIYREQGIILSSYDRDSSEYFHGTMMFMGTPGIGEFGVMESDPLLIRSEQKLKKQTEKLVILADSSKLGKRSNFVFCPLSEVDILITDSKADPELIKYFEKHDIEVIVVEAVGDE